jgi:predicted nuclease of predicted toxin-antitoxin system
MRLFAELYLDEDVSALVAVLLQARGFDAVTARAADMLGQDDPKQLAHAIAQERCMVTHNRVHFERLHQQYATTGQEHHGIIVAARRPPQEIARRLAALLNSLAADDFMNQLLYV